MHLTTTYLQKSARTRLLREPEPWPPAPPADVMAWFIDARNDMIQLFADLGPEAPSHTWQPSDQTVGFWMRRMAVETAIHTGDLEATSGNRSPIGAPLALDGIDEALHILLAGDWSDDPHPGDNHRVRLMAGDRGWVVTLTADRVTVEDGVPEPGPREGVISASPSALLLWLWRRLPDERVEQAGNRAAVARPRDWMASVTS